MLMNWQDINRSHSFFFKLSNDQWSICYPRTQIAPTRDYWLISLTLWSSDAKICDEDEHNNVSYMRR